MNAALVVIAGAVSSAMLFLSIILGSIGAILLTYLAMLPLFVIGLSRGGLYASIAGTIAALIVWATGGAHSAILYFLTCTLPASVLSDKATLSVGGGRSTAASWYPGGLLCVWLSVFPAAILIGTYLYFAAAGDGLEAAIATQIRAILGAYQDALGTRFPELGPLPLEQMGAVEDLLIRIAPGLAALIWMLATLLNGIAAQALLTRMKRNIRPSPQLAEIELPRWFIGLVRSQFPCRYRARGTGRLPAGQPRRHPGIPGLPFRTRRHSFCRSPDPVPLRNHFPALPVLDDLARRRHRCRRARPARSFLRHPGENSRTHAPGMMQFHANPIRRSE